MEVKQLNSETDFLVIMRKVKRKWKRWSMAWLVPERRKILRAI